MKLQEKSNIKMLVCKVVCRFDHMKGGNTDWLI